MKTVGITGPPGSGKSTLWRAITGGEEKHMVGTVAVPDPRLDTLAELHASPMKVPARLEFHDVHGEAHTQAAAVGRLRDMDAVLAVLPAFGGQDPVAALQAVRDDLLLADMGPIETRLRHAAKDPAAKKDAPALEAALADLSDGRLLRDRSWEAEDLRVFSPLAPITLKPILLALNVEEGGIAAEAPGLGLPALAVCAELEAEVAGLESEEARALLAAYGIEEPASQRVVAEVYRSLDLITFFTFNEKETRAWQVRRGAGAPEAAGVVHTDMQRGFIRAEVGHYESVVGAGSWDAAKARGAVRLEGRDYVVEEGDVVFFRFAV